MAAACDGKAASFRVQRSCWEGLPASGGTAPRLASVQGVWRRCRGWSFPEAPVLRCQVVDAGYQQGPPLGPWPDRPPCAWLLCRVCPCGSLGFLTAWQLGPRKTERVWPSLGLPIASRLQLRIEAVTEGGRHRPPPVRSRTKVSLRINQEALLWHF